MNISLILKKRKDYAVFIDNGKCSALSTKLKSSSLVRQCTKPDSEKAG